MTPTITSCLALMTTLLMVRGSEASLGAATPMEKAFRDVQLVHETDPSMKNNRERRSATGGVPCVSVPFLNELKERFTRWLDHDSDGQATFDEVKDYLRRFKPNINDEAVTAFIRRRDSNGNGAIDFVPEYVQDLSAPDYTMEGANEWFHLQDTNDDGVITERELMEMATALGMPPEQALDSVRGYYMVADADQDGQLSFDEFKTLYNQ